MTAVLFTGGGGAGNEAIFRLWRDRYDLHFADADPDAIAPSISKSRRHRLPMADDPDFVPDLAGLCRSLGVDVLVPGVDEELPHMEALAETADGLAILVPEPEYVATMLDKQATADALAEKGLPAPRVVPLGSAREIGFPCFAKPRFGRGSRGVRVIVDERQVAALDVLETEEFVAQELLTGQEYTVMMAADRNANLRAVVPVKVLVKRGITIRAETENHPTVAEACRAVHQALPARGCYNIQLMLTDDGRALPFEINPRVSTTFCLCLAAGIDPVHIFSGRPGKRPRSFVEGVRLTRAWHNHFGRMSGDG